MKRAAIVSSRGYNTTLKRHLDEYDRNGFEEYGRNMGNWDWLRWLILLGQQDELGRGVCFRVV